MKRFAQLAGARLRTARALGTARNLKELKAQFREAFVRCDWREARRLSEQLQVIDPRPPPTAEQLKAVREKFRRLISDAQARAERVDLQPESSPA